MFLRYLTSIAGTAKHVSCSRACCAVTANICVQAAMEAGVPQKAMLHAPFLDIVLGQEVDRRVAAMEQ